MNFWIDQKLSALEGVLKRVDMITMNDGEARLLTQEANLMKAGRKVQGMGPGIVIIKKGEHGALLFHGERMFLLPAYPLEDVFDPTGAGDSFAGGVMGYLTKTKASTFEHVKQALIYGTVVASFAVEDFGLERLRRLSMAEIKERMHTFRKLCHF